MNLKKWYELSSPQKHRKILYLLYKIIQTPTQSHLLLDTLQSYIQRTNDEELRFFMIPNNIQDCKILYPQFEKLVKEGDPFVEAQIFDYPHQSTFISPITLILDNIRSPFNVGSLFRSAEAFGIQTLILLGITPNPDQNPKIQKTAKLTDLYYHSFKNLNDFFYSKWGQQPLLALEKTNHSIPLIEFKTLPHSSFNLVVGNEEFGIQPQILEKTISTFHIDMKGNKNSMNVSVATGIALFYLHHFIH